jgi:hypothetical protein
MHWLELESSLTSGIHGYSTLSGNLEVEVSLGQRRLQRSEYELRELSARVPRNAVFVRRSKNGAFVGDVDEPGGPVRNRVIL